MPAFDLAAPGYDRAFTDTPLARALRARVWERLRAAFPPGSRVLELGCGTGEDARYLARQGVRVCAVDHSEAMLRIAREKCRALPVEFARLDLRAPDGLPLGPAFDGAFSNFGALNTLADYAPLAAALAHRVRARARLILVVMGRWCAWEIIWHALRLDFRTAFRRLRPEGATALVGGAPVAVHYPSTAALRRAFAPHFQCVRIRPLGLLLPPSYLEPLTRRRWFPFGLLAFLDRRWPRPLWADHTLYEFERTGNA